VNSAATVINIKGDSDDSQDDLKKLRQSLVGLIEQENVAIKAAQVMIKLKCQVKDSAQEGNHQMDMEAMFKDLMKKERGPKLNVEKHDMMTRYESKIAKHLRHSNTDDAAAETADAAILEEDGIITTHVETNIIDPITKREMADPVKNVTCGHSYERSSILELVSRKAGLRCPTIGCANRAYIQKNDLIDDTNLKKYIEQKNRH
jgi:hypothetical protein